MTDAPRPKLTLTLSGHSGTPAARRPLIAPRGDATAARHAAAEARLRAALAELDRAPA